MAAVSVSLSGPNGLLMHLCKKHLEPGRSQKDFLAQPEFHKKKKEQRLRRKVYDTLFDNLEGPHRNHPGEASQKSRLNEVEKIYGFAFDLRLQRKFDDANKLEALVDSILEKQGTEKGDLRQVLRFLVALSGSGPVKPTSIIGYEDKGLPIIQPHSRDGCRVYPHGPMLYGDTQIYNREDFFFMQYPPHVFQAHGALQPTPSYVSNLGYNPGIFEATPGKDLHGNGLFNIRGLLDDRHEKETRHTLFGALVRSHTDRLDVELEIPELSEDEHKGSSIDRRLDLKVPKCFEISEDEGFIEAGSQSSIVTTPGSLPEEEEDIWELALAHKPCKHFTWENLGNLPRPIERPFLTEAGPKAFDMLYDMRMKHLTLLDPSIQVPQKHRTSMEQLVLDVHNLMIGVPSHTFLYDRKGEKFFVRSGSYISGLSPESVSKLCEPVLACGTHYHRLRDFSHPPVEDSMYSKGLIFQAFLGGVRKYLQYYSACVLSLPQNKTLLELIFVCQKLFTQINYLAKLCRCAGPRAPRNQGFPTGVKLLSYVYGETLQCSSNEFYPMMLSLLNSSCKPYLLFVQDWVFNGVCRDIYREFMIQVNDDYLQFRDKHYWSDGFVMMAQDSSEMVPLFLGELATDIFVCGKSINLLKLCSPQHFMCNVGIDVPRVTITFSQDELQNIENNCQAYVSRMQQMARQVFISRQELRERAEKAKHDLMLKAKEVAAQELDRLQARIDEMKRAGEAKKRAQFRELKENMERDLKRRASVKELEAEEDKERMDAVTRSEVNQVYAERELERQARDELIEYYGRMTEEAAYREQKALWRVRRRQLDGARLKFLQREDEDIMEELRVKVEARTQVPDDGDVRAGSDDVFDSTKAPVEAGHTASGALTTTVAPPGVLTGNTTVAPPGAITKNTAVAPPGVLKENTAVAPPGVLTENNTMAPPGVLTENTIDQLPKWAKEGLEQPLAPVFGLDTSSSADLPKWAQKADSALEQTLEVGEVDIDVGKDEDDVFHKVSHPSQTSIADLIHSTVERTHLKMSDTKNALQESSPSQEEVDRPHVRMSKNTNASRETEHVDGKSGVRMIAGMQASKESEAQKARSVKASFFGHVSEMSRGEYEILAPKMKRNQDIDEGKDEDDVFHKVSHPSQTSIADLIHSGVGDVNKKTALAAVEHRGHEEERSLAHPSDSSVEGLIYAAASHSQGGDVSKESAAVGAGLPPQSKGNTDHPTSGNTESPVVGDGLLTQTIGNKDQPTSVNTGTDKEGSMALKSDKTPSKEGMNEECKDDSPSTSVTPDTKVLSPVAHVRAVSGRHVSGETVPVDSERRILASTGEHVTQETTATDQSRPSVKFTTTHISQETVQATVERTHLKMSDTKNALQESSPSQEEIDRPHIRMAKNTNASRETEQVDSKSGVRMIAGMHASKESDAQKARSVKASFFGHVSEMSRGEYEILAPKMKRNQEQHASRESDWYTYQIKPHVKRRKGQFASRETEEVVPKVRARGEMYATKESEFVDVDGIRLQRFREQNVKGHSTDSTVEKLLYGEEYGSGRLARVREQEEPTPVDSGAIIWSDTELEPYQDNFDKIFGPPCVDLLASLPGAGCWGLADHHSPLSDDVDAYDVVSLPVLLKRSVTAPLMAQILLVNKSIINYFLVDLGIEKHFEAMRNFLFMEDGEFGQVLSDRLFEKLHTGCQPHELLNPMFLNNALNKAFQSSIQGDSVYAENLSFSLKYIPEFLPHNVANSLDCLELRYKVDWPLNIIITESCMNKYNKVFSFMLQLKRIVWVLKDIWHRLKRDAAVKNRINNSPQFHQLQLYRHEMQHFVKVMQGYIANQVTHVTWQEFQRDLRDNVKNLDDLHHRHAEYLNKTVFRCLMNGKAASVMKIIQDILSLILKFHTQLMAATWEQAGGTEGQMKHAKFKHMTASYMAFKEYSSFLFKVVNKLAVRGYQPHLQELLLRLNYNYYYKAQS